jgi:hypothetical protein
MYTMLQYVTAEKGGGGLLNSVYVGGGATAWTKSERLTANDDDGDQTHSHGVVLFEYRLPSSCWESHSLMGVGCYVEF